MWTYRITGEVKAEFFWNDDWMFDVEVNIHADFEQMLVDICDGLNSL